VLIACVSPAETHVEESMNTLRYAERSRSIANTLKRNSLRTVLLSSAESDALRSENERLKAEIRELRRRMLQSYSKDNTDNKITELQNKLREAEEEAKATRESCLTVASMSDKWRLRCESVACSKVSARAVVMSITFDT